MDEEVRELAAKLHEECKRKWEYIRQFDPTRMVTQHMEDAHYDEARKLLQERSGRA